MWGVCVCGRARGHKGHRPLAGGVRQPALSTPLPFPEYHSWVRWVQGEWPLGPGADLGLRPICIFPNLEPPPSWPSGGLGPPGCRFSLLAGTALFGSTDLPGAGSTSGRLILPISHIVDPLCPCFLGQTPHAITCSPQNYLARAQEFHLHCFSGPATFSSCRLDCHLSIADQHLKITSRNPQNWAILKDTLASHLSPPKPCPGE